MLTQIHESKVFMSQLSQIFIFFLNFKFTKYTSGKSHVTFVKSGFVIVTLGYMNYLSRPLQVALSGKETSVCNLPLSFGVKVSVSHNFNLG